MYVLKLSVTEIILTEFAGGWSGQGHDGYEGYDKQDAQIQEGGS